MTNLKNVKKNLTGTHYLLDPPLDNSFNVIHGDFTLRATSFCFVQYLNFQQERQIEANTNIASKPIFG